MTSFVKGEPESLKLQLRDELELVIFSVTSKEPIRRLVDDIKELLEAVKAYKDGYGLRLIASIGNFFFDGREISWMVAGNRTIGTYGEFSELVRQLEGVLET